MAYKRKLYAGMASFGRYAYNRRTRRRYRGPGDPSMTNTTFGNNVGPRIAKQARTAVGGSMTMTGRKRTSSGRGVTIQHDARNIYRKRNMPSYKKKPWKKFVQKVHAVAEKDMGTRTVLFNDAVVLGNGTTGNQSCLTLGLYTLQSTNSWLSDLAQIGTLENAGNPTAAAGATVDTASKYIFSSGVLDITIRNTSFLSTTTNFDPQCTLEVDLYEITPRKDFDQASGQATSISTALAEGSTNTKTIGGGGSNITIASRGATPFDIPMGLSRFGLTITKKTKYFISNGQTITYQMRDPGRHTWVGRDLTNENGAAIPKVTKFVYIIAKAVPGVVVGGAAGQTTEQMTVGATRKYMYKIEGLMEDRARYISNTSAGVNPN